MSLTRGADLGHRGEDAGKLIDSLIRVLARLSCGPGRFIWQPEKTREGFGGTGDRETWAPGEGNAAGGLGGAVERSSSARWHQGQLTGQLTTASDPGGWLPAEKRRQKRRGRLWHHRTLLPLAAGLGLDDHLLRPHLPHLRAAVGTERLPGAFLHGQVVLDGEQGPAEK